ncbi:MAG: ATP-binding protein [Bacilli bacterium]
MNLETRSDIMLVQFKFKNYKSFYNETILDLTATQEKRHLEDTININGNKLLPVIAIHGANAAGKTNVLDALFCMTRTVYFSPYFDVNKELPVQPFLFSENGRDEDSEFEVSLNIGDDEFRYGFSLNKNGFVDEWLFTKKFDIKSNSKEKLIFERQDGKYKFGSSFISYENMWKLYSSDANNKKLLILAQIALKEENGIFRNIYNWIIGFNSSLNDEYNLNSDRKLSIMLLKNNEKIRNDFKKMINEFDPFLVDIEIKEVEKPDKTMDTFLIGIHNVMDTNNNKLPFLSESDGTIKMFDILPSILFSLENGSLLCIDELDTKLHPLLLKKIVNMYKDKKLNKMNAQLIYTTHSTFLFNSNDLRRDQIYLVEKNVLGESILYSLSEFKKLRMDADYEKKYLSGQFGGIPYNKE